MASSARDPRSIRMFPEYGAALPLWGEWGGLWPEQIKLSETLIERLRAWNDEWQNHPPEKAIPWSAEQWHQWRQRGYRLAWQVQAELPDAEVWVDEKGKEVPLRQIWNDL